MVSKMLSESAIMYRVVLTEVVLQYCHHYSKNKIKQEALGTSQQDSIQQIDECRGC